MDYSEYDPDRAVEIEELFTRTFSDSEGPSEGSLIGRLAADLMTQTRDGDLRGFVARDDGRIVGCVFFSRLRFENGINAFLLAPVAVLTGYQRKGIGRELIRFSLGVLRDAGVKSVFTYGDPAFYGKTGFLPVHESSIRAPFKLSRPEGWLCQSLTGEEIGPIAGVSRCVDAFNRPEYW